MPNTQLVKEGSELAARYQNQSVAEQVSEEKHTGAVHVAFDDLIFLHLSNHLSEFGRRCLGASDATTL